MKKIYSIYFLLGLFITAFYSCGEDLTPVGPDIAEITHFRNDVLTFSMKTVDLKFWK
ncbi:hypothetical protein NXX19_24100 [Bacteroides ovatus]|nr:hypothetical protein [Bacteroides ovatus]